MKTRLFCQALIEQNVTQPSQVSSLVNSYFGEGEYLPLNVVEDELKAMVNQVLKCYKEFLIRSIWSVCLRVEENVSCVGMYATIAIIGLFHVGIPIWIAVYGFLVKCPLSIVFRSHF